MDAIMKTSLVVEFAYEATPDLPLIKTAELEALLGYDIGELEGKSIRDLIDFLFVQKYFAEIISGLEAEDVELMLPLLTKSGIRKNFLVRGRRNDGIVHAILVRCEKVSALLSRDIEQMEDFRRQLLDSEDRLNTLAVRAEEDSLTKLLNAATTRQLCEEYIAGADMGFAIIIIDVDDFKNINDRYGHLVGDHVMCCVARTIKKLFRSCDVVGRIGGDEFLVLMKDIADRGIVELRSSQIVNAFTAIECEQMTGGSLSCSVGAAIAPIHGDSYDVLFRRADEAMYRAKRAGKNRFIVEK